ncbi:4Fe-4S domain-containing protein [Streptomyces cellostaticus]|uniref:4Fe-4S domain-containing protein n=1 Tax=Streptomyces cellostaticus TaxID=67285 RepID=UPI0020269193|nr:ferredoxin [Streptomyces cellostaticus]
MGAVEGGGGGWRVDSRCINCDAARQLAPGLIKEASGRSVVVRQPRTDEEVGLLQRAAHACPTRSVRPPSGRLEAEHDPFPLALDERVYLCGHHARRTAGAASYLLRREDGSSVMVDTPRWGEDLAARYETLGPVTDVLLTHRDHAAHGRQWADRLGARLWIHEGDREAAPDADRVVRGIEAVTVVEGVIALPFPGHTRGSILYLADDRYCFSGDSFYWSRTTGDLEVAESVTWYSIEVLAESLGRAVGRLQFEWLLPGHGEYHRLDADAMAVRLRGLAERTGRLAPRPVDFTAVRW